MQVRAQALPFEQLFPAHELRQAALVAADEAQVDVAGGDAVPGHRVVTEDLFGQLEAVSQGVERIERVGLDRRPAQPELVDPATEHALAIAANRIPQPGALLAGANELAGDLQRLAVLDREVEHCVVRLDAPELIQIPGVVAPGVAQPPEQVGLDAAQQAGQPTVPAERIADDPQFALPLQAFEEVRDQRMFLDEDEKHCGIRGVGGRLHAVGAERRSIRSVDCASARAEGTGRRLRRPVGPGGAVSRTTPGSTRFLFDEAKFTTTGTGNRYLSRGAFK